MSKELGETVRSKISKGIYIGTGIALNLTLLAACGTETVVSPTMSLDAIPQSPTAREVGPTPTDTATATDTPTPTDTLTETPTSMPTAKPEAPEAPLRLWDWVRLTINGQPVDVRVGMEYEPEDVLNIWAPWHTEGVTINKDMKGDYRDKFAKMIAGSLWQASINGGSQIPFEQFLANSNQYPISFTEPDGQGGFKDVHFTLGDVKAVDWRIIDTTDPRLYFLNPNIGPRVGYKMRDNGTLVIYTGATGDSITLDVLFTDKFLQWGGDKKMLPYIVGDRLGSLMYQIVEMGNTSALYEQTGSANNGDTGYILGSYVDRINKVKQLTDYPTVDGCQAIYGNTGQLAWGKYEKDYGFWVAIMH